MPKDSNAKKRFQSLVKSNTEIQRANHQLMEELSSRPIHNAAAPGLGAAKLHAHTFNDGNGAAPSHSALKWRKFRLMSK